MTRRFPRLFFFLFFLVLMPDFAAACTIPGIATECNKLVSELPWPFIIHVKEQEPVRITYMSTKEKQQLNPNLKLYLEVREHDSCKDAREAFFQIERDAHPDMGLSYGWDLVLTRDKRIYRLHADCTLAEHHFNTMVQKLKLILPDNNNPKPLFCRCGGSCRATD